MTFRTLKQQAVNEIKKETISKTKIQIAEIGDDYCFSSGRLSTEKSIHSVPVGIGLSMPELHGRTAVCFLKTNKPTAQ